jgi:hypothetical protein
LTRIPTKAVYNIDETEFQEWQDGRVRKAIVLADYVHDKMSMPFNRTGKRTSLIVGIRTDKVYLKPLAAIARKIYEAELMECRFSQDNCLVARHESGFLNGVLFPIGQWKCSSRIQSQCGSSWATMAHISSSRCVFVESEPSLNFPKL